MLSYWRSRHSVQKKQNEAASYPFLSKSISSPYMPSNIINLSSSDWWYNHLYEKVLPTTVTYCDDGGNSFQKMDKESSNSLEASTRKPSSQDYQRMEKLRHERIEQLQKELDEPCSTCLYTGVATCTGLSIYFAYHAMSDSTLKSNRRFLWICSAGSVVAGAYRWHLG